MLVDVEVQRDERRVGEHQPLGLLEQRAAPRRIDRGRGARQQRVISGAVVVRQVEAEVALQVLGESLGVVVVAHPARAEHLDVAAIDVLEQRLELHLREAHLDPERLLPHRGDGERELGVHFARVVAQLEAQRPRLRVARLAVQALCLGDALRCRLALVVEGLRRVVSHPRRHPAVGRQLPDPQHQLRELLAVDHERQRTAQFWCVLEGRPAQVEAVVVGRELRRDVQFRGQVLADPVELSARHHRRHLELPAPVARQLGVLVRNDQVLHRAEARGGVVPVPGIFAEQHVRALHPLLEHEGAVGHHDPGARVAVRVFLKRRPVHRAGARMREERGQVKCRRGERHHQRAVVGRGDA